MFRSIDQYLLHYLKLYAYVMSSALIFFNLHYFCDYVFTRSELPVVLMVRNVIDL